MFEWSSRSDSETPWLPPTRPPLSNLCSATSTDVFSFSLEEAHTLHRRSSAADPPTTPHPNKKVI